MCPVADAEDQPMHGYRDLLRVHRSDSGGVDQRHFVDEVLLLG
jgi:hypothetical protein